MTRFASRRPCLSATLAFAGWILGAAAVAGCTPAPTRTEEAAARAAVGDDEDAGPSIGEVAADPASFEDRELKLAGRLDNEGENYFTDLRVVLRDDEGALLHVWPWLPTSLPPAPPGATGKRPEVLSDYLGKKVELTAKIERRHLRSVGEAFVLVVEEAKVLDGADD